MDAFFAVGTHYALFRGLPTLPAGGDEQIRTVDPLLARQVLSQLSYTPMTTESVSPLLCFFKL